MEKYRYEILDDMESTIALADSLEDAIYAAKKHQAKLIYDKKTQKCVAFEFTELPSVSMEEHMEEHMQETCFVSKSMAMDAGMPEIEGMEL